MTCRRLNCASRRTQLYGMRGGLIRGLDAITAWRMETGRKYNHTVEPLTTINRDGKCIVTGKVTGNFPGSPISLDHIFEMNGDGKIVALELRSGG